MEFNDKSKGQHSAPNQKKAVKRKQRVATIVITPDNHEQRLDCQINDVTNLEILEGLKALSKVLAQQIIDDAIDIVGDNEDDINGYLDYLTR